MIEYYQDPDAKRLSVALWDLARPGRPANERDDRMFNVLQPVPGVVCLEVDTEFEFVVDLNAVLGDLADILQPRMSAEAIAELRALVLSLRGQRVVASTTFAQVFNGQPLSLQDMYNAGWLTPPPQEEINP